MKNYSNSVRWIVAVACSICLSASASAQKTSSQGFSRTSGFSSGSTSGSVSGPNQGNRYGTNPQSGTMSQQRSSTSVSGSRSVSFKKDGKRVSITENASGISVTVNGKRYRAKNPIELKRRFPDAYRLYDQNIGAAQIRGSARGSAGGSASAGSSRPGAPGQFNKNSTQNRSVSVMENGKKVSITENKTGITVTVNGKRVRAKNVAELKKKFPDAFKMYEKHLRAPNGLDAANGLRDANDFGAVGGNNVQSDATALLREELGKLRDENAGNPQLRSLIDKMMQNVPQ